uniref:Uncharacterized protein n=1 Tax=Oryza punctata TaxID=4537 RepID=A0A0E0K6I7_ORYPU
MDQRICSKQDGQSDPPPPTPAGDHNVMQTTPSLVSPHPLSAPPPSPIPVEGLPMLLLSWEAIQDGNPAVATVASSSAQPVEAAASRDEAEAVDADGSMYRHLHDRVEGGASHPLGGKRSHDKKARASPAAGAKGGGAGQGIADSLAEMTKRDVHAQQTPLTSILPRGGRREIEEFVGNHAAAILDLKDAIGAFQSKDMGELARFHRHVEHDEQQLAFEGFPSKKLETLRMAAALYSKLDGVVAMLKGWKLQAAAPVSPQLDMEEETKRFVSDNVHFDFAVLIRIKECMVDLSSSCVEKFDTCS